MQVRVVYLETPIVIDVGHWSVDSHGALLLRDEFSNLIYAFADGAWSCCEVLREDEQKE